jgi:hypothetical protein
MMVAARLNAFVLVVIVNWLARSFASTNGRRC